MHIPDPSSLSIVTDIRDTPDVLRAPKISAHKKGYTRYSHLPYQMPCPWTLLGC